MQNQSPSRKWATSQFPSRDPRKEMIGWLQLAAIILIFPALFFFCVFFPIWVGWTPRFP
ncbi:MAG: hypothetical protein KA436_04900 [Oligoflexales bacterium]|nr:hypothetical protein [Oligoflexales bacterium]